MTLEEAMAKATKLMRLAKSSNVHEAALAAQRAQEILTRFDIDQAAIDVDADAPAKDEPINREHDPIEGYSNRIASWKLTLASRIGKVNACQVFTSQGRICVAGRATDVAKLRYLYEILRGETERLTRELAMGRGRSYANSFRIGCVHAIGDKLREAYDKAQADMRAQATGDALVRIDKALARLAQKQREITLWVDLHMNLRNRSSSYNGYNGGHAAGYAAGQTVNVGGNGQARLGSGAKRLR